jgi:hypothetical protein
VKTGALAAATVMARVGVTAACATPFEARILNVEVPFAVGVPERTPVEGLSVSPGGREPLASE